jgi:hypothetical protein
MLRSIAGGLGLMLSLVTVGQAEENPPTKEPTPAPRVSARIVDSQTGSTTLYIYNKAPLLAPRYSRSDRPNQRFWMEGRRVNNYYLYTAHTTAPLTPDVEIQFTAASNDLVEITDKLTIQPDKSVVATPVQTVKLSTVPELPQQIVNRGHCTISPNNLAYARAREMARRNWMGHLGGGCVQTTHGTLFEGSGMGGPNCHTCTASDGSAAYGDGQCQSASGQTYRSRLYRCGTVSR